MNLNNDTIVAIATPPGIGAIGVIRLSGKGAIFIANSVFRGKNLEEVESHTIHFGTIRDFDDKIIDEVLVSVFVAPRSYTREDVVEISCHGSPYIQQQILELLLRWGARMAQPGEFTMRAFLNGQMDLSQAEAVADLIAAQSEAEHKIAMQQMRGGFSNEIATLRQELVDFAALIELELDFSQEDVEFADRTKLIELVHKIQGLLRRLMDSFQLGNAIKNGVSTVIAGRPNAGKSTLLNALLNEERAIVSDIAGTTRDTIEEMLNIKGVQFRLVDTAGIREASDQIEAIGVEKTLEKIAASTLLIYVFDVIEMSPEEVTQDLRKLHQEGIHLTAVANKMDLNPYTKPTDYVSDILPEKNIVTTSAINKMNIEYLKEHLYQTVASGKVSTENTVVSNARHYDALQGAYASLDAVLAGFDAQIPSDLVAMDIRHALNYLGLITGEVGVDDLLDSIFTRFCIGK